MLEHPWEEKQWDDIDDKRDHESSDNSSERISCYDGSRMHRGDEELLYRFLEFCSEKWGWYIRIGIRDDCHEDDTRDEKCDIVPSSDFSDTRSDESSEDDKVECLGDDRWEDGLWPDPHYADELFSDDSIESYELNRHEKRHCLITSLVYKVFVFSQRNF